MNVKRGQFLVVLKHTVAMAVCSIAIFTQEGCIAMPTNSVTSEVLHFKEHAIYAWNFASSQMNVIYGRHLIYQSVFPGSRPEVIRDKTSADEKRDLSAGGTIGLHAFEGPLQVKWHSKDGKPHEVVLNLEDVFKDRVVLHREDPTRIDPSLPMQTSGPTIVVEVNDRTLNIYMDVHILLRPTDPNARTREDRRNHTLAYSKTF